MQQTNKFGFLSLYRSRGQYLATLLQLPAKRNMEWIDYMRMWK
jgi:hypothetical protein